MSTRSIHKESDILRRASDVTSNFDRIQRAYLHEQGLTKGMIHHLELATADTSLRVWILDNSTSTNQLDSYRVIRNTSAYSQMQLDKCTRWEDIKETAMFHAQIATYTRKPTLFRLLNTCLGIPSEYTIPSQRHVVNERVDYAKEEALDEKYVKEELDLFQQWLQLAWPTDRTPLIQHIQEIHNTVQSMEQAVRVENQKVVLTIATDGLPCGLNGVCNYEQSDLFRKTLRTLEKLPVQIVFRLNTNHSGVQKYYTELKNEVRFRVTVMNSFLSEAQSIRRVNNWLTYTSSIHRMRECGAVSSYLDSVAERGLSLFEMRDYCIFLFGYDSMTGVIDPTSNGWSSFILTAKKLIKGQNEQWDPCSNKVQPMLDVKQLSKAYGPSRRSMLKSCLFRFGL